MNMYTETQFIYFIKYIHMCIWSKVTLKLQIVNDSCKLSTYDMNIIAATVIEN